MTYADELESDFLRFYGLDLWDLATSRVMRLAPRLPVYEGALRLAMTSATPELPPAAPQAVDNPAPAESFDAELARRWDQHVVAQFQSMGVQVTGLERISDDDMEAMVKA